MNRPAMIAPLVDQAPEPLREYIARLEHAAGDDFRVDRIGGSHVVDPDTSREAALFNLPRSGSQREAVLLKLVEFGANGATFEQLQTATKIESAAKRLTELVQGGWALQTTATRKTHTGAKATVHIASQKALSRLEAERSPRKAAGGGDGVVQGSSAQGPVSSSPLPADQQPTPLVGFDAALEIDAFETRKPSAYDPFRDSEAA